MLRELCELRPWLREVRPKVQRLECSCSVEGLQLLAHVAGVKAVVCHSCWDACGYVNCKIGVKKHFEKQQCHARVADPFYFALEVYTCAFV